MRSPHRRLSVFSASICVLLLCLTMAAADQLDLVTASYGRPVAWAYGRHVVGGNVIVADDSDPQFPVRFFGLGHGPWNGVWSLNGVPQIWLNGVLLGAGEYHFHPGTDGQYSSGGGLVPESTGGDQKVDLWYPLGIQPVTFSRLAYLAVRFDASLIDPSNWDFRAILETRLVQWYDALGDPDGAPVYTENPARAFADLLLAVRGLPPARLNWPGMLEAEADCDHDIGGGVPRFVSNVAWPNQVSLDQALRDVCDTCRGFIVEDSDGLIYLKVAKIREKVKSFTKANIIDASPPVTISQEDVSSAADRLDLSFADPNNGMQVISKPWDHLAHQAAIGDIIPAPLNLPAMPQSQAERLGNYKLTRAIDLNETVTLRAGPDADALTPGDVIDLVVDEDIWSGAETYEIEEATDEPTLQRELTARLYRDAAYSDAAGASQNLLATTIQKYWGPGASHGDSGVPPAPLFHAEFPGDGTIIIGPVSFPSSQNTTGISSINFVIVYLNPDPLTVLLTGGGSGPDGAVLPEDTEFDVSSSAGSLEGDWLVWGTEVIRIDAIADLHWTVHRGWLETTPIAHDLDSALQYIEQIRIDTSYFQPGFFAGENAGDWRTIIDLPEATVAVIYAAAFNAFGESATATFNCYLV